MIDDKMREAVDEQLPRDRFGDDPREYFCMGYEAACASKDAEIAELNSAVEVAVGSWAREVAAKDAKIKVALDALQSLLRADEGGIHVRADITVKEIVEAIALLGRRDGE